MSILLPVYLGGQAADPPPAWSAVGSVLVQMAKRSSDDPAIRSAACAALDSHTATSQFTNDGIPSLLKEIVGEDGSFQADLARGCDYFLLSKICS